VELYINSSWTKLYSHSYIAEALAWSENGNHATIFATGNTADEAHTKLLNALRELSLIPEAVSMHDELHKVRRKDDLGDPSGAC
jgi:hypothetical protein